MTDRLISLGGIADKIGALQLHREGITGKGVNVAVIDTGFIHPFFSDNVTKKILCPDEWEEKKYIDSMDDEFREGYIIDRSHGPLVTGAIGGKPTVVHLDNQYFRMVGAAPGANLILIKSPDEWEDWDIPNLVIERMNIAVDEGADIICMAFGSDPEDYGEADIMVMKSINSLTKKADVLFSIAAGNEGPGSKTINPLGDARGAITVGSVSSDFTVSHFSSRGPNILGEIKPDIMSIGGESEEEVLSSSLFGTWRGTAGTSIPAGTVAGVLALLLEAGMPRDRAIVEEVLAAGATFHGRKQIKNNDYGWGVVNAYRSYQYLKENYIF